MQFNPYRKMTENKKHNKNESEQNQISHNKLVEDRLKKLQDIKEKGINPYPYSYNVSKKSKQIQEENKGLKPEEKSSNIESVAGRIILFRRMGKVAFLTVRDEDGDIQLYLRKNDIEDSYDNIKDFDMGDFIGAKGKVFKTKTGEITIYVSEFVMLCKAIRPLPDKFHGLNDMETRYRKRYLDLIMNKDVKERFKMRSKIITLVREYLNKEDFIEVETPTLQVLYGGTNAKPFKTHINAYDMPMYLRVAPELYLKRLVVGGFEKVYEIGKNFRNEGVDQTHNPEFTMIEWYESYIDYNGVMDRAEALYKYITKNLFEKMELKVDGKIINIDFNWPRISMTDAIKEHCEIDVLTMSDSEIKNYCNENKLEVRGADTKGQMIMEIFERKVTDKLVNPVWIIDYPKEVSPLSKAHRTKEGFVERFECYINGKEIGDGWSEIIDPRIQRARFDTEQTAMRKGNEEAHPMDEDFIESLEYGMPPLGGIGIGIDRLVMLFTDYWAIRDVLLFPIMKPEDSTEVKK